MSVIVDDDQNPEQLYALLNEAMQQPREVILAETVIDRHWQSDTRPAVFSCSDGNIYVVKGLQEHKDVRRSLVTDHIVAHLGVALGAAVGQPHKVEVAQELIELDDTLYGFIPGTAHATRFIPNCVDGLIADHPKSPENRPRFALLALLYGWCSPSDRQFLYEQQPPRLVHSVDHGHFFPRSVEWNIRSLQAAQDCEFDDLITGHCDLRYNDCKQALQPLDVLTTAALVQSIAAPLGEWGITMDERVELLRFFIRRRNQLLALYP